MQNSSRHDGKEVDEGTWASERTVEKKIFFLTKVHYIKAAFVLLNLVSSSSVE